MGSAVKCPESWAVHAGAAILLRNPRPPEILLISAATSWI